MVFLKHFLDAKVPDGATTPGVLHSEIKPLCRKMPQCLRIHFQRCRHGQKHGARK